MSNGNLITNSDTISNLNIHITITINIHRNGNLITKSNTNGN